MVPPTPNIKILIMLQEVSKKETYDGLKIKIIETGGKTFKREVQQKNPTETRGCSSGHCLACKDGKEVDEDSHTKYNASSVLQKVPVPT